MEEEKTEKESGQNPVLKKSRSTKDGFHMVYHKSGGVKALLNLDGVDKGVFLFALMRCEIDKNTITFNVENRKECAKWITETRSPRIVVRRKSKKQQEIDQGEAFLTNNVNANTNLKLAENFKHKTVTERAVLAAIKRLTLNNYFLPRGGMVFLLNPYFVWKGASHKRASKLKEMEHHYEKAKAVNKAAKPKKGSLKRNNVVIAFSIDLGEEKN